MKLTAILIAAIFMPLSASALEVFACEPEWASLVEELAGDKVAVTVATTAYQDPHRLQAKPSLIAAIRKTDLLVCTGADLEIGWLPLLLRRAGNSSIQAGNPGYFMASDYVRKLEIPRIVDRSQGDIHPQGNPHVHLNPRNIQRVADAMAQRLTEVDPANAATYEIQLANFQLRWSESITQWETRASGLAGLRIAAHHRSFSYLVDWLDLDIVATLESKPGIPPSGAHLAALLEKLLPNPPVVVVRTPYENEKPSLWLAERLSVPERKLPYTIAGNDAVIDLFTLFDETLGILAEYKQ